MNSNIIRQKFLAFFEKQRHAIIPSASLVPENDPTVLFNTAGMQPLVPYLMGAKHPKGDLLANVQKCLRTTDIDDIGDNTHATFFEMLGNWSLGSYFKEDAIKWSYEFLTSKEDGLGLDPTRLYITVFAGDEANNIPRDDESAKIWQKTGIPENCIFYKGVDSNWWPAVKGKDTWTGPTGPSSEMFYDVTGNVGELFTIDDFKRAEEDQTIVEVWNDVFMEYEKREGKIVGKLSQKNVDTGAGLERLLMVIQNTDNIFNTDVFLMIMAEAGRLVGVPRSQRIIADHIKSSVFLITDGVTPSNTDRGYILRRLLRRAIFYTDKKDLTVENISSLVDSVANTYMEAYPEVNERKEETKRVIGEEVEKFRKTLQSGLKQFQKIAAESEGNSEGISGKEAFILFSSYGFPVEMTVELAKESGISVDIDGFDSEMRGHQALSRSGSEQKFKGGLADTSEMSVKYHTATHLLNAALRKVLGNHVMQKGSNITPERLRFDFTHDKKMTDDEKKRVEDLVNEKISEALPVSFEEVPLEKAREMDAVGVFGEKYADIVKVYTIGGEKSEIFSREICGGPHVQNTNELGHFKIQKEEAVSAGVRRIKAVLE